MAGSNEVTGIPETVGFAVMTVSDTLDSKTDKTGP